MDQKLLDKGQWWEEGIELVSGCNPCSIGCDNCWSAEMTYRFSGNKGPILAVVNQEMDIPPFFTGNIICHPERLSRFNTRKPKVFAIWNDLFHEAVPDNFRFDAYLQMSYLEKNTFLILTKRPQILLNFYNLTKQHYIWKHGIIYHGLTVCTQAEADEKIPVFLQVPGKKFLCLEPLLEGIDIIRVFRRWGSSEYGCSGVGETFFKDYIDAVIVGTETGPHRRPAKLEWIESIIDQCDAAGVPVFVKAMEINGKVSKDMADWPEKFRRRELPWIS